MLISNLLCKGSQSGAFIFYGRGVICVNFGLILAGKDKSLYFVLFMF